MEPGSESIGGRVVNAAMLFSGTGLALLAGFEIAKEDSRTWWLQVSVAGLIMAATILWVENRRLDRRLRAAEDLLADVRFGPGTRRDRDAVDILVRALRTPDAGARETALRTLRKISGLDLGDDAAAWETWWRASRTTFVRPGPPKK